jgi:transcriptional regulator with XRE-family HTH domain
VTVSNWETGRQEPSWQGLIAIAQLTCLPLEYFAGIGTLEDYPAVDGASEASEHLMLQVQTLIEAFQRLDAERQRIMIRQVEVLLDTLGQQELSEGHLPS